MTGGSAFVGGEGEAVGVGSVTRDGRVNLSLFLDMVDQGRRLHRGSRSNESK